MKNSKHLIFCFSQIVYLLLSKIDKDKKFAITRKIHYYRPVKINSDRGFFTDATILQFTLHDIFTAFKNGPRFNREIGPGKQT